MEVFFNMAPSQIFFFDGALYSLGKLSTKELQPITDSNVSKSRVLCYPSQATSCTTTPSIDGSTSGFMTGSPSAYSLVLLISSESAPAPELWPPSATGSRHWSLSFSRLPKLLPTLPSLNTAVQLSGHTLTTGMAGQKSRHYTLSHSKLLSLVLLTPLPMVSQLTLHIPFSHFLKRFYPLKIYTCVMSGIRITLAPLMLAWNPSSQHLSLFYFHGFCFP